MSVICVKKCYWRGKLWNPGDTLVLGPEEKAPCHFLDSDEAKKREAEKPKAKVLKEPKTLKELGEKGASFFD